MEHTPNSGPESGITKSHYFKRQSSGSPDICPDEHNFPLTEYITIHNATKVREGPRYPAYNSRAARLRSYTEWPHGMNPSPSSFSTAGFYFSGNTICPPASDHNKIKFGCTSITYKSLFLSREGDMTRCFHSGVILGEWRTTDDPFTEHARWFPNYVYVRHFKGEAFVRDCQRSHKTCTLM